MTPEEHDALVEAMNETLHPAGWEVASLKHSTPSWHNYEHERKPHIVYDVGVRKVGTAFVEIFFREYRSEDRPRVSKGWPLAILQGRLKRYVEAGDPYRRVMSVNAAQRLTEAKHQEEIAAYGAQVRGIQREALPALLQGFSWDMESFDRGVSLEAHSEEADKYDKKFERQSNDLHGLMEFNHHSSFEGDGYRLRVDDGEVRLTFEDSENFERYRKEWSLRVNHKGLERKLANLEEKAERAIASRDAARSALESLK